MEYTYTGPTGPTADYAGDPNDYYGSGSSFNANSLIDSIFGSLGGTLSGVGSIIAASKGNPVTYVGGQPVYPYGPPQQQQPQQQNNTALYIVLAVVVLLLVLGGAYVLLRK